MSLNCSISLASPVIVWRLPEYQSCILWDILLFLLQFWPLHNARAGVAAYNCFYNSCLCWESPEWPGTPRAACESLCSLFQPWVMVTFTSPGTSLRALQRVTLEHTLCFVDQKVVVVSEHLFQGKNSFIPSISERPPHIPQLQSPNLSSELASY